MKQEHRYILAFDEIDKTKLALVGGKGAGLAELSAIEGIQVPEGFCVTTDAYKKATENNSLLKQLLNELAKLKPTDLPRIRECSKKVREAIENSEIPKDITAEIEGYLSRFHTGTSYAVRSSATAEDLPAASFAGQQATFLNVIDTSSIIDHIRKCWASLFTVRAVVYRMQNGFDHRQVYLAVVVQQMIFPDVSGILFTADPVSFNRKIVSIDASFGLGEALVSGIVSADNYKVRNQAIIDKKISVKKLAINAREGGGTAQHDLGTEIQSKQALTDEQILALEQLARKIESHFGQPQDIEWCFANNQFYILQSRPITTLFPVPQENDLEQHVYISVGHQQMMTDAMKPFGLSFFLLTTPAQMRTAGGRLFVDVTKLLQAPGSRKKIIDGFGKYDQLVKDALTTVVTKFHFDEANDESVEEPAHDVFSWTYQGQYDDHPTIVSDLIKATQESIARTKQIIQTKSGTALFDFIIEDIAEMKKVAFNPQSLDVIMTGMHAATWLNEKIFEWLGEKNVADTLSQSVPDNVTSEMGLALLDVADAIRPYPDVIAYLQNTNDADFLDGLYSLTGGKEAREAILGFLNKYGMRCAGEIDISKPRWAEKPSILIPVILTNVRNFEHGAAARKFDQGRQEALKKEKELVNWLRQWPGGETRATEVKRMIDLIQRFAGYREFPKFGLISRYFVYKQALQKEAELLVEAGIIHEADDIYYLSFQELRSVVEAQKLDYSIIDRRKEEFRLFEKLTPPRVMTSEGEIIHGKYSHENLPANALAGLAVSSGVIEGRARVILTLEGAHIEEGDILVTAFTDPSWTPLFVSIKGLVTEVGGLMTHGAVIAREYGLPAVVAVENATRLIKEGDWIRVNGTEGFVEIVSQTSPPTH